MNIIFSVSAFIKYSCFNQFSIHTGIQNLQYINYLKSNKRETTLLRKFYKPSEILVDDHLLLHKHVITFFYEIPR